MRLFEIEKLLVKGETKFFKTHYKKHLVKNYIICCDWGTSSLRIRLVDKEKMETVNEDLSKDGIAKVFERWKAKEVEDPNERVFFYLSNLQKHLNSLKERHPELGNIPVIISGMASSSIGMMKLPYAEQPFSILGENALAYYISASDRFEHPVVLLSGVRDDNEVMRGEESQLVGVANHISRFGRNKRIVVLMPGTHSKHVYVQQNLLFKIETHITGELFAIVSQNGLIKEAVQTPQTPYKDKEWEIFLQGVGSSGKSPLLRSLFKIRTNQLFEVLTKQHNYIYLSGLLIGYELRSLIDQEFDQLVLCCESGLFEYYKRALIHLNLDRLTLFLTPEEAEKATIKGQIIIASKYLKN